MKKLLMLIATLALVASACGGGEDDAAALPINTGDEPAAIDATCLADEPDCSDTLGGEPQDLPISSDDEPSIAISVADALDTAGPAVVTGFFVDAGGDFRLCEALAESFPPQCGGASIALTSIDQIDPDDLQSEGSVTWTDYAVTIFGEMVDGTLVATPIE